MTLRGTVAAGHAATAEAAATILRAGGNAFDAALAALAAACVAEPVLASLGGGGFLLARDAGGDDVLYDFFAQTPRQRRPAAAVEFRPVLADFGTTTQEFHIGAGAIATPGMARGLVAVHGERGALPLAVILEPAIALARDGVTVTPFQALLFQVVAAIFTATPSARACFGSTLAPDRLVQAGERHRQPALADTLARLAEEGDRPFYEGDIAAALVAMCAGDAGHLTPADMTGYRVVRRRPLTLNHRGARIAINPPPSWGGMLIAFALRLLEPLALAPGAFGSPRHVAALTQVMAQTNKARVDSGLHTRGAEAVADALLDPAFVAAYAAAVGDHPATQRGTTHVSVLDAAGNAAAMSLSNGEGCGAVIPGTGYMPNNMLGEADLNPAGFHRWTPDRRIASMMAPAIVDWPDGRVAALGSGGSNRIRTAILQVLINLLDFAMPVDEAVGRPRLHNEDGRLDIEPGFAPPAVAAATAHAREHKAWPDRNMFFGGVHTAALDPRGATATGAGDPRRAGVELVVE